MRKIPEAKKEFVLNLVESLVNSSVVGIARVDGIPAPQLQKMRARLRGRVNLVVGKNRLITMAIQEASSRKEGLEKLCDVIEGQTAVITTDMNPFSLFKELETTKTSAPAKGGEVAPKDIVVKAGDTPFKPGPIVGDLQKAGIPAAIEGGKVVIKKDKILVEAGERIPKETANALTRLEIFPLTVGLDLRGAHQDNVFYQRESLVVDEDEYKRRIQVAGQNSLNLAVFIAYPNRVSLPILLVKASQQAFNLAILAEFLTRDTAGYLLQKAHAEMLSLASRIPEALDDEFKGMISPQKKVESSTEEKTEKKEEVSEEEAASGLSSLFG